jgi:hypothetical protein
VGARALNNCCWHIWWPGWSLNWKLKFCKYPVSFLLRTAGPIESTWRYLLLSLFVIFVWPCIISIDGKEENQLDAKMTVYWYIQISSTCFRQQFCPSSGALDCVTQLVIWCTQWVVDRWSGKGVPPLPDHRPITHCVHHTASCVAQSNAPDDGQNCCPKHVELIWIYQ